MHHEVHSGNRTDDTIHRGNLGRLRQILGRSDFIYIADSKLCTAKNLQDIDQHGGFFVTVLPGTRGEDQQFRARLRQAAVRWRPIYTKPNARRKSDPPDVYDSTTQGPNTTCEGYRIVWVRSSQKALLDQTHRAERIRKAQEQLHELDGRLNRGKLRRLHAARKAVAAILKKHGCEQFLHGKIHQETRIRLRRLRRGRPRSGDPLVEQRTPAYRLEPCLHEEAIRADSRTDGVFGLVTNLPARRYPKKEILLIYKYQPYVEKRHALLKSELEVAPVYLKKPQRAVGMIHAHFLAMVVEALIERTVRQAMKREGIDELPLLPEGRMTGTPTAPRILEAFSNVAWYEFERGDDLVCFPLRLSPLQKTLLRLLGMDSATYA